MKVSCITKVIDLNLYSKVVTTQTDRISNVSLKDRVEISNIGKTMNKYVDNYEDINRQEKVNEIKAKIENNEYTVDAKKTAESIMKYIKESRVDND